MDRARVPGHCDESGSGHAGCSCHCQVLQGPWQHFRLGQSSWAPRRAWCSKAGAVFQA